MTKEQVYDVFSDYIRGDNLVLNDFVAVDVNVFYEFFKSVSDPTSYAEYVALDDGKGYIPFFDRCKSEGTLS